MTLIKLCVKTTIPWMACLLSPGHEGGCILVPMEELGRYLYGAKVPTKIKVTIR